MLYAHSHPELPEDSWQTLEDHLRGVSELARAYASFGTPETAALLGNIHDTGKRSASFQARLHGKGGKVDHTSAAYQYLMNEWSEASPKGLGKSLAQLLAYPLLGHHGGMADYGSEAEEGTLAYRLSGPRMRGIPDWKSSSVESLPAPAVFFQELKPFMSSNDGRLAPFATAFLLRMLYSCLVDADFLDTERFCTPEKHVLRPECPPLEVLEEKFFQYLFGKGFLKKEAVPEAALTTGASFPCGTAGRREAIQLARLFMLQHCISSAEERTGLFSLTMPTGGGKTLSSMAFALRHARKHGLKRIILVVPYTSIIEQNADVLREALGEDAVLEHHSNFIHPDEELGEGQNASIAYKLSTENWDATVIVTTSVQFFESLFDNRPSRCRKLHNIAKSVIILDEVQMLPVPYVKPCLKALKLLSEQYGSSIVLCTATQPALIRSSFLEDGFLPEQVLEIIPASASADLFRIFERVKVEQRGIMEDAEIADFMKAEQQVLCIVNSRKHAGELYRLLDGDDSDFHLSARMTPEHRTRVLAAIRLRLEKGLPCRVVSTSLIECGVDISFPVVMREKNGLDVLAQSAGRCNREGREELGRVICFSSPGGLPKRAAELARRRQAFDEVSSRENLFCPEAVEAYFTELYRASKHLLDEKGILQKTEIRKDAAVFQFKTIAEQFKFIEEDTAMVVIERGEAAELLNQEEIFGGPSPSTVRKLQRHSVQVRYYELERMKKDGRIEVRNGFLNVLSGGIGYSEKTGLDVTLEDGVPVDDLMF